MANVSDGKQRNKRGKATLTRAQLQQVLAELAGKPRRKVGRPRIPIDPDKVKLLAAQGCSVTEISSILHVDRNTVYRNFAAELAEGRLRGDGMIRRVLFEQAVVQRNPILLWKLAEFRLNLKQPDPPAQTNLQINLTPEQIQEIRKRVQAELAVENGREWNPPEDADPLAMKLLPPEE